ncbi:hypothetical protein D9758_003128 [Tetrapyrgos nigripes]|uniref:mRNA cap guanine-N(7) methyltransferase n=1 Tax=Tetrapyrgos nigripes TaxID=182062 RepID=A0A8H5GJ00_9AGAR|nr:hypothetical protein D9758_003128 [Tetrapyrgos nigripes]
MSKRTPLRDAVQAIKAACTGRKKAELTKSLERLSRIASILEQPDTSPERINGFFPKESILPLLESALVPTLRCCFVFFDLIFKEKIASPFATNAHSWEEWLETLIGGILDHLESSSTPGTKADYRFYTKIVDALVSDKVKSAIGVSDLYSFLCQRYFPSDSTSWRQPHKELITSIHSLLSDSVIDHLENQRKLRDAKILGGNRIGLALSLHREYLPIESLLQFIANLRPAASHGYDKNTSFIESIFVPSLFPLHKEMKRVILETSATEWDKTLQEIIHLLAQSNSSFPQPFPVMKASFSNGLAFSIDRLYVDHKGLITDVVLDGGAIDTFYVHIQASSDSLPVICTSHLKGCSQDDTGILTLVIPREDREKFAKILKARGLHDVIDRRDKKLSKPDAELSLEFEGTSKSFPVLFDDLNDSSDNFNAAPEVSLPYPEGTVYPETSEGPHNPETLIMSKNDPEMQINVEQVREEVRAKDATRQDSKVGRKRKPLDSDEPTVPTDRKAKKARTVGGKQPTRKSGSALFKSPPSIAKKYGNKGRTSSPQPEHGSDSPVESPSSNTVAPKTKAGNVAAMKGKGGRKVIAGTRTGKASADVQKQAKTLQKKKFEEAPSARVDHRDHERTVKLDDELSVLTDLSDDEIKDIEPALKKDIPPKPTKSGKKKPRKAPWELDDFIQKIKNDGGDATMQMHAHSSEADDTGSFDSVAVVQSKPPEVQEECLIDTGDITVQMDAHGLEVDHVGSCDHVAVTQGKFVDIEEEHPIDRPVASDAEALYEEYIVPTKTGSSDTTQNDDYDASATTGEDTIMIDLTSDDSPEANEITESNATAKPNVMTQENINIANFTRLPNSVAQPRPVGIQTDTSTAEQEPRPPAVKKENLIASTNAKLKANSSRQTTLLKTTANMDGRRPQKLDMPQKSGINDTKLDKTLTMRRDTRLFKEHPVKPVKFSGLGGRTVVFDLPAKRMEPMSLQVSTPPKSKTNLRREPQIATVASRSKYVRRSREGTYRKKDKTRDIVEILNEIQEVVISKISNRFETVRKEVRMGRDVILRNAAEDVENMRLESITHFNAMVDLEMEYGAYRRRIGGGLEELDKVNEEIEKEMKKMIGEERMRIGKAVVEGLPASCFDVRRATNLSVLLNSDHLDDTLAQPSLRRRDPPSAAPYNPTHRISPPSSVLVPMTVDEIEKFKNYQGKGTLRLSKRKRPRSNEPDDFQPPPPKKLAGDVDNSRPDVGVLQRLDSPIIGLKNFNNWVKSVLISTFAHPALAQSKLSRGNRRGKVLDLGCGKGGDLTKWTKAKIMEYVGSDIAAVSIDQARSRWEGIRAPRFDASFAALDCYSESLAKAFPPETFSQPFDAVSMQFCMHYAFESESKARCMLDNVSRWLRDGGIFIGTIPNAEQLLEHLNDISPDNPDLSFGNQVYKIRFETRDHQGVFGHKYWFFLRDAVEDVPEYVVVWDNFVRLASEYNLHPIYKEEFHQVFAQNQEHREFGPLLVRMKVVDINGESSMDEDQWEAANIYIAFAFQKQDS